MNNEIQNDRMMIDRYGKIAKEEWYKTTVLRNNKLHEFNIMPNHLHGIIGIDNHKAMYCRGTTCRALEERCAPP